MNSTGIDGYRDLPGTARRRSRPAESTVGQPRGVLRALEANPVRSAHPADRHIFLREPSPPATRARLDRKMLFLLATAKLNQAERFGVGLGETYGRNSDEDVPPERVYLELEEHYHTRLLAYVLDIFGLTSRWLRRRS